LATKIANTHIKTHTHTHASCEHLPSKCLFVEFININIRPCAANNSQQRAQKKNRKKTETKKKAKANCKHK